MLQQTLEASKAKDVTAIVMDPSTGGVLGVASAPGPFAAPHGYRNAKPANRRIRAFTDQYEPGSTFKAVTFADGLARAGFAPTTKIEVPTAFKLYDRTLTDAEPDAGT